jgi:hypothetical protein
MGFNRAKETSLEIQRRFPKKVASSWAPARDCVLLELNTPQYKILIPAVADLYKKALNHSDALPVQAMLEQRDESSKRDKSGIKDFRKSETVILVRPDHAHVNTADIIPYSAATIRLIPVESKENVLEILIFATTAGMERRAYGKRLHDLIVRRAIERYNCGRIVCNAMDMAKGFWEKIDYTRNLTPKEEENFFHAAFNHNDTEKMMLTLGKGKKGYNARFFDNSNYSDNEEDDADDEDEEANKEAAGLSHQENTYLALHRLFGIGTKLTSKQGKPAPTKRWMDLNLPNPRKKQRPKLDDERPTKKRK